MGTSGSRPSKEKRKGFLSSFQRLSIGALRRSEGNVLLEDVDLEMGEIIVRGTKNGDDKKVQLTADALEAVKQYLSIRPKGASEEADRWLFISQRGAALGDARIYRIVKESAARAGIQRNVWTHLLRHTKITDLARKKVDPWTIQRFAGHRNIATTMEYVHLEDPEMRKTIIAHPLIESKKMEVVDLDDLKLQLTMRLARGEIDATSYSLAMSALQKERA